MNEYALTIAPKNLSEVVDLAERLSKATLIPKALIGKPADTMLIMMTGQELGMSPASSLRLLFAVDGKVGMFADTMVALALSSGKAKYFRRVEESDAAVTYETLRIGDSEPRRCTWTRAMVLAAGLNTKENHRLFPRQMLASRAKSELARDVYPDVLGGFHTPDELTGAAPLSSVEMPAVMDVDFIDVPVQTTDPLLAEIESAPDIDAMKQLGARCNALPKGAERKAVVAAFKAKMTKLDAAAQVSPAAEAAAS